MIKFETDSFTMIKIINRNNLHSAESLNCFWKSTFKTITKMDYDKKGSTYKIDFLIVDAGGSRDFACDDVNQRCINRIEDTISILVNLCFKKGGFDLACDSIKSIYLDFKVLPNGCITDIYIDTMFCNFPEKFKNDLYGKLTKLSFGKIIKNDTVSISVPITLAKN